LKTIAFFNNKGGVGKTSLVFHVGWMMSMLGVRTIVVDLDPQANVTNMFLSSDDIESLWGNEHEATVYGSMKPLISGIGDIRVREPLKIEERLFLVPGDLSLSEVEDQLSETWPKCLSGNDERAFRVTTAFSRIIRGAAQANSVDADVALLDVGPNFGAINRAALVAADYVIVPLSADMFSIKGLQNVGPMLRRWRRDWKDRIERVPPKLGFELPSGSMEAIGYVISRFSVLAGGPVQAFQKWLDRAPETYFKAVMDKDPPQPISIDTDKNKLARLKDYRSLMPMAQEARKPMFLLKPADGAIGGHQSAVGECRGDFEKLAVRILQSIGLGEKIRQPVLL
jgi:chromosome partitioning protein